MTTGKPSRSQRLRSWLLGYPRGVKQLLLLGVDLSLVTLCLGAACLLKFDSVAASLAVSPWIYACAVLSALVTFASLGLYRAVVRFTSFRVLFAIFFGGGVSALCIWLTADALTDGGLPKSLAAIYWLNVVMAITGSRILARWVVSPRQVSRLPVVIYGAGEAGAPDTQPLLVNRRAASQS